MGMNRKEASAKIVEIAEFVDEGWGGGIGHWLVATTFHEGGALVVIIAADGYRYEYANCKFII